MAKITTVSALVEFVGEYNLNEKRGCPKGVLQHAQGATAKLIQDALDSGKVTASKGSHGGLFTPENAPVPTEKGVDSLKGQMAEFLREFVKGSEMDEDFAANLVQRYDDECARRSVSAKERHAREGSA